jgi:hypothetical protein
MDDLEEGHSVLGHESRHVSPTSSTRRDIVDLLSMLISFGPKSVCLCSETSGAMPPLTAGILDHDPSLHSLHMSCQFAVDSHVLSHMPHGGKQASARIESEPRVAIVDDAELAQHFIVLYRCSDSLGRDGRPARGGRFGLGLEDGGERVGIVELAHREDGDVPVSSLEIVRVMPGPGRCASAPR